MYLEDEFTVMEFHNKMTNLQTYAGVFFTQARVSLPVRWNSLTLNNGGLWSR